ncbi:MAG: carboxypeptidase regulatory-like domain-containing protein [Ichthyobacteriaceae bacterium]|nr:carboxypeptidase regulatory-like domain-containing protein [Ichthyobacteriaceae bacterium]
MRIISNKINLFVSVVLLMSLAVMSSCEKDKFEADKYGTLSGTVTSDDVGVEGVSITTSPVTRPITTDADGKFIIEDVPEGNVSIRITKDGYLSSNVTVNVINDEETEVPVKLSASGYSAPISFVVHAPADNSKEVGLNPKLDWGYSSKMKIKEPLYDVYMSSGMAKKQSFDLVAENLTDTTFTIVNNLNSETTYHWYVELKDGDQVIARSVPYTFTTQVVDSNKNVVYSKKINGVYDIFRINLEGGDSINVTNSIAASCEMPVFSKDRSKIAFLSLDDGGKTQIFVMDGNGKNINKVTDSGINMDAGFCWSEKKKILFPKDNLLQEVDIETLEVATISTLENKNEQFKGVSSGGGKIIALIVDDSRGKDYGTIISMTSEGKNIQQLINDGAGREGAPSLSLDGTTFVYTISGIMGYDGSMLNSAVKLSKVNPDGSMGIPQTLKSNPPGGTNDINARFASDGYHVVFENVNVDGTGDHRIMKIGSSIDTDGKYGNRTQITTGEMPNMGF